MQQLVRMSELAADSVFLDLQVTQAVSPLARRKRAVGSEVEETLFLYLEFAKLFAKSGVLPFL